MKTIRLLAAWLLLLTGILHLLFAFMPYAGSNFVPFIVFGIVYFLIGLLILSKKDLGIWLGLLVPLIPIVLIPNMIAHKTLGHKMMLLLGIDMVIIVCCLLIVLNKSKHKAAE